MRFILAVEEEVHCCCERPSVEAAAAMVDALLTLAPNSDFP